MVDIYTQNYLQQLDSEADFNYTKICNYIQQFLARTDQVTIRNIPSFISLAENRLANDLKFLAGVQVAQIPITPALPLSLPCSVIVQKPNLWRQTKSMSTLNGRGRSAIYGRSYEYLQTYLSDFSLLDLEDQNNFEDLVFYADYDQNFWILGPYKRNVEYTIEVLYFSTIQPLDSTLQVNYWTQYAPRSLIYAALCEASYFLRSDERTQEWTQMYQMSLANLTKQNIDNFNDNSTNRTN
jgi:hypothetical protein